MSTEAAVDYTFTALLAAVKRRGMIPATDEALSSTDYLALMNEELFSYIVPLILSTREEYFVAEKDVSVVANQNNYDIPERAIGMKLRSVKISNSSGGYDDVPRIEPERVDEYSDEGPGTAYYLQGNEVILVPTPTASATLRLAYFRRPGALVAESSAAKISSVGGSSLIITTTSTIPSGITSGVSVDIIDGTPGFDSLNTDLTTTATTSGTTITVTSAVASGVGAKDWVALAGQSPVPQIPYDLFPLLIHRTIVRAYEALGWTNKLAAAEATSERLRQAALTMLSNRVEGSPRVVVNRNAPGWASTHGPRFRG